VEEKKQKQTEHDKTSVNNEVHNPSTPQLTPTPTPTPTPDLHDIQKQTQTKEKKKDKKKSDILISKNKTVIKIKSSFQIQMSRNNTQEMTIVRKSTTNRSSTGTFTMKVVLKFYLQTARERDVLYTVLNALITKKKEMEEDRNEAERDVIRLEIYPIGSNEKDGSVLPSSTSLSSEDKKKFSDMEKT